MIDKYVKKLNRIDYKEGKVAYWMSRDQRVQDNKALFYAQKRALETKSELVVFFNQLDSFKQNNETISKWMKAGLNEVSEDLKKSNISFYIIKGNPAKSIPEFVRKNKIKLLVTDFSPLRASVRWKEEVCKKIEISAIMVDAHNTIAAWKASDKQEYSAYTFRKKLTQKIREGLRFNITIQYHKPNNKIRNEKFNNIVSNHWLIPGENEAKKIIEDFCKNKVRGYAENRNDPTKNSLSNISPYLHFGNISAQTVARKINEIGIDDENTKSYLEELIVRKELSDNYCYYNKNYDNFEGFPNWAKKTHEKHKKDKREFIYSLEALENAKTHDALWNAAQQEMVNKNKMHGYMRMYWCKKIMEWTEDVEQAQNFAIYLNDKYFLDGRDPNGYTGIAWSLGGVHDRPWFERQIFGQIRYMNYSGAERKFDVKKYIKLNNTTS